ncbi:sensor histidine kinase [Clostridium chrysemydis]|uniref:sensor histidine kinase n=1 Tax=Clostridium chrysemydis TaxID=2665504 RepID=UPI00188342A4|nr:ATP-binding protein [Clostridium chrysemydis]
MILVPIRDSIYKESDDYRGLISRLSLKYDNDISSMKKDTLGKINDESISDKEKGENYVAYIVCNLISPDYSEIIRISEDAEAILIKEDMQVHLSYLYFYLAFMYSEMYDYNKSYVNIYKANEIAGKLYSKNKSEYVTQLLISTKYLQACIESDLGLGDIAKSTFSQASNLEENTHICNYFDTINSKINYYLYVDDYDKVIELSLDFKNRVGTLNKVHRLYFYNDMHLAEAYINKREFDKATDIVNNYNKIKLVQKEVAEKYRIYGKIEEEKGYINKALDYRKKEYDILKTTKDYRGQLRSLEKILVLTKKTNNMDDYGYWNEQFRGCVENISKLKGTQYLIGSLGDIELQNARYNNKILELESKNIAYIAIIVAAVSISIISVISIANRNKRIRNEMLSSNIDILSNQLNYQYDHYNSIIQYQEEVRRLWHDMKHHTNLLNTLIEKGEYDECRKYLASMSNTIDSNRSKSITRHSILDAILANKQKICSDKDINLILDIKVPKTLNINNFDLCVIFKNLLDNAIEANLNDKNKERYISVKSMVMNKYLYIEVLNSKTTDIVKSKGKFLSSKTDGKLHGLGIESVKKSIEKYDGNIKFEFSDEWFKVTALLKNEIKQ